MARVKRGNKRLLKRKKILDRASGFYGTKSKAHRMAKLAVDKALGYAYRDRRQKKRHFRSLWVTRLNAALKQRGVSYNRFIPALVAAGIELNRKMLSELAITDAATFDKIVELVRPHLKTGKEPAPEAASAV